MNKSLRIACDGEAASGKSTGAKLVSKKYKLFLINSGLLYRYASKIVIKYKPKKIVPFLKKKFKNISYNKIKKNKRICVEGRDIASTILKKNPRYDLAFYFTCNLNLASIRRWKDLKKKVPLKEVKKSLSIRTRLDKKRKHSPLKKMRDAILIRTDKLNKKKVLLKMSQEIEKINYKTL